MQRNFEAWARLESVIKWANMNVNYFARHIGLARGENLYQIKRGNNGISLKMAKSIIDKFPQVDLQWLLTGDGEMLTGDEYTSGAKPFFNVDVEREIRQINQLKPCSSVVLPQSIDCDFAILYYGRAMGAATPPNTTLLLKKISPEMIIPGHECVIVTKNIVLLRIVRFEDAVDGQRRLRLRPVNTEDFDEMMVDLADVETAYSVKGKILINN